MSREAPHYRVERVSEHRLIVRLRGAIRDLSARELQPQVLRTIRELTRPREILIELTEVTECTPAACRTLALLQRKLGSHGCRTAYLVDRPRLRGVAWWIVHAARDDAAMPVLCVELAERWLTGTRTRLDELETRAEQALAAHRRSRRGDWS